MNNSFSRVPVVTISRRGAERIRAGHVWVYRSDVVNAEGVSPGAVVLVQEEGASAGQSHGGRRALIRAEGIARATRTSSEKNVRPTRELGGRGRPPHTPFRAVLHRENNLADLDLLALLDEDVFHSSADARGDFDHSFIGLELNDGLTFGDSRAGRDHQPHQIALMYVLTKLG